MIQARIGILISITILTFNIYENKTIKIKPLLCHVSFTMMLLFCLLLRIKLTSSHLSLKAQTHSHQDCDMFSSAQNEDDGVSLASKRGKTN